MSSWFSEPGSNRPAAARLFCFPFAGGAASAFLPWQALLAPSLELRVATLPGHGQRLFEPPLTDLTPLVGHLADAVAGLGSEPFAFYGHSMGAVVAFEVARELRRRGRQLPVSLWVSGAEGPQSRRIKRQLADLPDAELIEALRDYNGMPAELLDEPEMMQLLLPGIRADFAIHERYRYQDGAPLELPVHVLTGEHDPYIEPDRAAGWALETTMALDQHSYAGDHFFIYPQQAQLIALLQAWAVPVEDGSSS